MPPIVTFSSRQPGWIFIWENFHPAYRDLASTPVRSRCSFEQKSNFVFGFRDEAEDNDIPHEAEDNDSPGIEAPQDLLQIFFLQKEVWAPQVLVRK